jgi:phage tail-like protein
MDINGTRFHMLLGEDDWSGCKTPDYQPIHAPQLGSPPANPPFAWDERNHELTLQPEVFLFTQQSVAQAAVNPDDHRRGVGADRFGNIYWIDENGSEIKVLSAGSATTTHFWSAGDGAQCIAAPAGEFAPAQPLPPPAPHRLGGLAVTCDHYLVVGVLEPAGLLVFDLYTGGAPQQWLWPSAVAFVPFDIAPRPQGGVWILDRVQRRVWALDRLFNVVPRVAPSVTPAPAEFESAYPDAETPPVEVLPPRPPITLDAALLLDELDPIAIEPLSDDSFVILAQPSISSPLPSTFATIARYAFDAGLRTRVSTDAIKDHLGAGADHFRLIAHDFVVVPLPPPKVDAAHTETVKFAVIAYMATRDGNQCFAFELRVGTDDVLQISATPHLPMRYSPGTEPAFLPMRLFGGKGLVAVGGEPYYDFGIGWVPLKEQRRPRYPERATLVTRVFDGREPQCHWHRLLLDAVIPPDCSVQMLTRATDDAHEIGDPNIGAAWNPPEPALYRRRNGSEIAYAEPPTRNHEGTWELLFQDLRGRYAQLQLIITGDQRSTPRLRALRVYYPRFSYLTHYLPAAYREDASSAAFLDRFLANFEGTLTAIEDRIAAAQVLFDPQSAPRDALPWLADWLGVALDPAWTEDRRRLFIRRAMDFFQWRGTAAGLTMALRVALDDCADEQLFRVGDRSNERRYGIRVVEAFQKRRRGGRWQPTDGPTELSRRYRAVLNFSDSHIRYPLLPPEPAHEAEWRAFSDEMLGFVPAALEEQQRWQQFLCSAYSDAQELPAAYGSVPALDQVPMPRDLPPAGTRRSDWEQFQARGQSARRSLIAQWHGFLARRYRTIDALNEAYGSSWGQFDEVAYPVELPDSEALLKDWFGFEGTNLGMQRAAHRFQVLLPLFSADDDETRREERRALARRIVELEKPAHTVFDVQYYWALFLVGTARVGHDTQLDVGSRAPQLAAVAILNKTHLGSSYLATDFPPPGARRVLGEGALGQGAGHGRLQS